MHDELLDPLDNWVSRQPEKLSRAEAIRTILREYLTSVGVIPLEDEKPEGEE